MKKKRNPIAKTLRDYRPQRIPAKRREEIEWFREAEIECPVAEKKRIVKGTDDGKNTQGN